MRICITKKLIVLTKWMREYIAQRFIVCVYFCPDENETISSSSTTRAKCSPRWIVYPDFHACCAYLLVTEATTQQQCLDACIAESRCIGVQWFNDILECRFHRSRIDSHRTPRVGLTTFELIRQCDNTSGITITTWAVNNWFKSYSDVSCVSPVRPVCITLWYR